ncbi:SpoIIE family protein phosphatase, partial [candidate division KSB3 bacterium]|nr:SpoIIE family protein phosphatase [candidate division KSB3 bacterium]MBD3325130.1 SpoIIE family protein phosphatase [candidate division KSB3 bacterium]
MKKYFALCVDDEQAVLNQLASQLEEHFQYFCEFEYAESAEEGMEVYRDLLSQGHRVWLIICDQVMPGMAGDAFLASIHEIDRQAIKVLLTGQAGLDDTIRAINHAGLNYYIEKPWEKRDLLMILDRLRTQYEISMAQRIMAIEREKWLKELSILYDMNMLFASSIDLRETLNSVFYNILNVIQAEAGSIFLIDEPTQTLICRICQGPKDITGARIPVGTGIVGHVAKTRKIDVTTDVKRDKRHFSRIDEQSGFVTKSMVSMPLVNRDDLLGVIQVINKKGGKTFSQDDVNLLQSLSSGASLAIQNAKYSQRLLQQERMRSELLIAHQIQQGILPDAFPRHPHIHIEAVNHPAKDVGGDFYDYFQINPHEVGFVIGDVCGKGIPAAIFMASARSIIKSQCLVNPSPAHVMHIANKLITEDAQHGMFVTVFYGVYNSKTARLQFSNAGHTLPFLYRPSTASCASLFNTNFPLGVFDPFTFQQAEIALESGDLLILYTDGINESFNLAGEQFGLERLVRVILENANRSPQDLQDAVLTQVREFSE